MLLQFFDVFQWEYFFFHPTKPIFLSNYPQIEIYNNRPILSQQEEEHMKTMSMATRRSLSVAIGMKEKTNVQMTRQDHKNFQQVQDKVNEKNIKCSSAEEVRDLILKGFDSQVLILKVKSTNLH